MHIFKKKTLYLPYLIHAKIINANYDYGKLIFSRKIRICRIFSQHITNCEILHNSK